MARQSKKLTANTIKNAGDGKLFDGDGLALNKTGDGGKWVFRYSISGRRREMGLGRFPDVSLADARRARDRWSAVLRDGRDPIAERNRSRSDELAEMDKDDPTLEDLIQTVFDARKATLRGEGERGRWLSPLKIHVIPKIGHRRISTIHQTDIRNTLAPIWSTKPDVAQKAMQRLRIVFKTAKLTGLPVDPFTVDAAKHMLGSVAHTSTPIAATPWQDIPALFERLNGNAVTHMALRWLILTAARGMPVRGAMFDEIEGDVWTVPADRMKGRAGKVTDFRIPLSPAAMDVLHKCREMRSGVYLFPSYRRGKHITDTSLTKALRDIGEEGRPHGFRTSFRTWVQDKHTRDYDIAETALAHTIGNKVERAYARSDLLDQRRILMTKWGEYVTGQNSSVVQLRGSNPPPASM